MNVRYLVCRILVAIVVNSLVLTRKQAAVQFSCNDMDLCILRPFSNEMRTRNCPTLLIHFDFVNLANAINDNKSHAVIPYAKQHRFHHSLDALCREQEK